MLKGHGNQLIPGNGLVGDDVTFVDIPRKAAGVLNHDLCGVVLDVDRRHILIGAVRQRIQQSLLKNTLVIHYMIREIPGMISEVYEGNIK